MAKKTLYPASDPAHTPSTGADVCEAVNYLNEQVTQIEEDITSEVRTPFRLKDSSGNDILDESGNPIYNFLEYAEAPLPTVHSFDDLSRWNHAGGDLIRELFDTKADLEPIELKFDELDASINDLQTAVEGIESAIELLSDTKFDEDNVSNDTTETGAVKVWSINAVISYVTNKIKASYDNTLKVFAATVARIDGDIESDRSRMSDIEISVSEAQNTANLGSLFDQFAVTDSEGNYVTDNGAKIYAILQY